MHPSKMVSPPVVCGVDRSEQSRRALHEAVTLARALDARLDPEQSPKEGETS